ncbi:MAG: hypothetical protein AAB380_00300, partial [Verrucomicrobiota bacterium]
MSPSRMTAVAQVSKPAVSPTSKSAGAGASVACGFGNPRYSRLGSLRYITAGLVALAFAVIARAQPTPRIGYVYPAGGRQGATFQVTI